MSTSVEPQTDAQIGSLFGPLFETFESASSSENRTPLLAHYTSIRVMENILRSSEVWFSNPLFMNDMQEMVHGLNEGTKCLSETGPFKKAGGSEDRAEILRRSYYHYLQHFDMQQAFDTYVFCLTEHDPANNDGLLSMWRGYGQHGNGAALVFDTSKITLVPTSPLIFGKVSYVNNGQRTAQIQALMNGWAELTESLALADDKLHLAAHVAFSLVKGHALMTKHSGFSEENEWRVIYYPERDTAGALNQFLNYHIGDRGVEPKLKYQIGHIVNASAPDLALERLLDRIILGPSLSSPLALRSVQRMLDSIGKPNYKPLLRPSAIPLRPNSGSTF